jgi:PUA domain protein
VFFYHEGTYLPSLKFIRKHSELKFPKVQVDEGAVNFVINGADIFTQGIIGIDQDFPKNTIVTIVNPQNAVLCLGKSLLASHDLLTQKGKGIQNLHYLGDNIWNEKF